MKAFLYRCNCCLNCFQNIKVRHTNTVVERIQRIRNTDNTLKGLEIYAAGLPVELFDHVIVATQANQAAKLFSDWPDCRREKVLKKFEYVWSDVVIHSDEVSIQENLKWYMSHCGLPCNSELWLINHEGDIFSASPIHRNFKHTMTKIS